MNTHPLLPDDKARFRATIRSHRSRYPAETLAAWDALLVQHLASWIQRSVPGTATRIAAYFPVGAEPGAHAAGGFLPSLSVATAPALEILIPKVQPKRTLTWHIYQQDQLTLGPMGLMEPAAAAPAVPLESAQAIIAPALGVSLAGIRLGQGGGFYDRALAGSTIPTILAVHPGEVFPDVPHEPWDARADGWTTALGTFPRCERLTLA